MKDTRCCNCRSTGLLHYVDHVLIISSAPRSNYGDIHRTNDPLNNIQVVAKHAAVSINGSQENFTGSSICQLLGPFNGIPASVNCSGVTEATVSPIFKSTRVDASYYTLHAKTASRCFDESRIRISSSVDSNFVCSCMKKRNNLVKACYASTHGKRNSALLREVVD